MLVSLQRWTPMYWDQERYGMLVPLLALPFRDPLANLLVQRGLLVFAGLASVVLLARYALAPPPGPLSPAAHFAGEGEAPAGRPGARGWLVCGLAGAASLLALMPAPWLFEYLGDQPYGLSLALAILGLLIADPRSASESESERRRAHWRLVSGALLVLLGHWVNAAAGLFLAPVALARALGDRFEGEHGPSIRRRLLRDLGLLGLGLAAGQASIWLYPVVTGYRLRLDMGTLPLSGWPRALSALLRNGLEGAGPAWAIALVLAVAAGLAMPRRGADPSRRRALFRALALVAAAIAYALVTAALRWVEANHFHWRYLAPSLVLAHLAGLSLLAEAISRRALWPALGLAVALVPAAAFMAYGPPSPARVRADLDAKLGTWTEDVLAARCDLVAGDYWTVWPAVWHAGWVARGRGLPAPYGITHRTNPTVRFWKGHPPGELRVCRVRGAEEQSEYWLRAFHLWPVRRLEERKTVEVVVPTP